MSENYAVIAADECKGCRLCVSACPRASGMASAKVGPCTGTGRAGET
ncbi:MAG: 4Fe-4S binding protein [Spirochaetales bacterium]|nr:4Fe-4S binding protein [Spirochaetales bacterium]